jgi:hypothetical protein
MNRREPRGDPPPVVTKPPTAGERRRFSTRRHSSFALTREICIGPDLVRVREEEDCRFRNARSLSLLRDGPIW